MYLVIEKNVDIMSDDSMAIVPFHNVFSPSGEQPEQRKLAHTW